MLRQNLQPEPLAFNSEVRLPGHAFLDVPGTLAGGRVAGPSSWSGKSYWTKALPWLRDAYGPYCVYSGFYIHEDSADNTVDHILPKRFHPYLAYEWSNLVLCGGRRNGRKGVKSVCNVYDLEPNAIMLEFLEFKVYANIEFAVERQEEIEDAISNIGLNRKELCLDRRNVFEWYQCGRVNADGLKMQNPFVYEEAVRTGLIVE